jgi:DNA-binding MarR family transcriptional regulator
MDQAADDLAQQAWRGLLRTYRRVSRALDADLAKRSGIPLRGYEALERLSRAPRSSMRMSDLATSLLLSASGITRLIDQLVERQWVERQPDPSDARVAIACLTREGRNALRRASLIYADGVKRHFAAYLGDEDISAVAGAMERLLAASMPIVQPTETRTSRKRRG